MKVKATKRIIKNSANTVIGFGYCEIQRILSICNFEPTLYSAGVYGWNCDFMPVNYRIGICTGYNVNGCVDVRFSEVANDEQKARLQELEQSAYSISFGSQEAEILRQEFVALLEAVANK